MIYVNPFNDLLTTSTTTTTQNTNQINYANQYYLTQPSQVRSSSTSSSLSSVSSTSTSPQMSNSQINPKQTDLVSNQIYNKNISLQTSLYPAYTGYTYLNPNYIYSQPNTRLLTNNVTNYNEKLTLDTNYVLNKTTAQTNTSLLSNNSLTYIPNSSECSYYLDQTSLLPTTYLTPTYTDLTFGANFAKTPFVANRFKLNKKKFKKPPEFRKVLPKNSLMLLHELRQNVEYRFVSQSGPIHRPIFTMCVDINEHKFEGSGKTKKLARMQAAEKAVEFLMANPEFVQKPKTKTNGDDKNDTSSNDCQTQDSQDEENDASDCESEDSAKNVKKFKSDFIETNNC